MLGLFGLGLLATWWPVPRGALRLRARRGRGLLHHASSRPRPAPRCEYTTNVAKQAEAILFKDPDIQAAFSVAGFSFSGAAPNNGLIFTRLKDYDEREGKSHSLAAVLNRVRGPDDGHPGRPGDPLRASGHPGPVGLRRIPVRAARPDGRRHLGPGRRHRRPVRPRRARAAGGRPLLVASGPTTRSWWWTSTATRRAAWTCRCARSRTPSRCSWARPTSTTSTSTTGPTACTCRPTSSSARTPRTCGQLYARADDGAMVPAGQRGAHARDHGAPGHQPLQPVPLGRDQRRGRAGVELRPGPAGHGARSRARPCRRASTSPGRASRCEEVRAGAQAALHLRAQPDRSCTWCWPRSTRAGSCPSSSCWACRWPSWAAWARSGCAAWPTTSSARSASSC